MRMVRLVLSILYPFLVVSCAAPAVLLSEEPLGHVATLNPQDWNGIWWLLKAGNGKVFAKFTIVDPEKGIATLQDARLEEGCLMTFDRQSESKWRQSGNWFFSSPEPLIFGVSVDKRYAPYGVHNVWLRDGVTLTPYVINKERARTLILRKLIAGRIEDDQVILEKLSPEQYELLFPNEQSTSEIVSEHLPPPVVWRPGAFQLVKLPDQLIPCKNSAESKEVLRGSVSKRRP